jgi:excisionase family DNA binding protein
MATEDLAAPEMVTIAEASRLLRVHRNTIRNRIKAGRYKATKVLTPQGETYAIPRAELGLPVTAPLTAPSQPLVHHNGSAPLPTRELAVGELQARQDAVVQRLLAPFVHELQGAYQELGRLQERVATLEAERDRLNEELVSAGASPPAEQAADADVELPKPSWWRRLLYGPGASGVRG